MRLAPTWPNSNPGVKFRYDGAVLTLDDIIAEADNLVSILEKQITPDQLWREVPIRDSLRSVLMDWKSKDDAIQAECVINRKGKRVSQTRRAWNTALRKAGIDRKIRPYDLRHAFATEAIAAGADVGTVTQIMGNDSRMLLAHYQHVVDERKRSVVEALRDIPKFTAKNYGRE